MHGYSPIMPQMDGMSGTATNAAVVNSVAPAASAGGTGGIGNWQATNSGQVFNTQTGQMQSPGFFGQGGMAQIGLGAISTLGTLWNSFQQNKIAKKSLALQERTFETNLSNQTQTYNTELEDRIRNRYAGAGATGNELDNQTKSYVDKNKL